MIDGGLKMKPLTRLIPKIKLPYRSKMTMGYKCYREFIFPTWPRFFITQIINIIKPNKDFFLDEMGILKSHNLVTKDNYTILSVGVGSGISLIHNVLINENINFIAIEASKKQIHKAIMNANLNKINSSQYKIIYGFVGEKIHIYNDEIDSNTEKIDLNMFEFDVLELDCEGSEVSIIKNLTQKPKHIIVEMHPTLVEINFDKFNNELKEKNYFLNYAFTIAGEKVDIDSVNKFFSKDHLNKLNSGASWLHNLLVLTYTQFQ